MAIRKIFEKLLVGEYQYPLADEVNPILLDYIINLESNSNKPSNIMAKMTSWNIMGIKEVDDLVDWINTKIHVDFLKMPNREKLPFRLVECKECWGVLYQEGDAITKHNHTPSQYSFTYYVNVPEGSSPLVFPDSRYNIQPLAGQVVIFESRLTHMVLPNKAKNRCAIAGNFAHNKSTGTYGLDS